MTDITEVQSPLVRELHVIAPGLNRQASNVFLYPIKYVVGKGILAQILNQIVLQVHMSYLLATMTRKMDFWIFVACDVFTLPVLTVKLLRGRVMLSILGSLEKETTVKKNILNPVQIILKRINCSLADRIIVFSDRLIDQWGLARYRSKIIIAQSMFVDVDLFRVQKPLTKREMSSAI